MAHNVPTDAADTSHDREPDQDRKEQTELTPPAAYDLASSDCETAYMSGDRDRINAAVERLHEAGERYARWAQRSLVPSFEDMLRDPTTQMDPKGEVLASIVAYRDALPASACACRGSLHKICGSSS